MFTSHENFNPVLTGYVQQASLDDQILLGQKVLPIHGVKNKKGTYPKLTLKESRLGALVTNNIRAPHAPYEEVRRTSASAHYLTKDRGFRTPMDDTEVSDWAEFFDLEKMNTKWLAETDRRTYEVEVANTVQNTDEFDTTQPVAEYLVANVDDVDFGLDLDRALRKLRSVGVAPNQVTVICTGALFDFVIKRSKKLQDYLFQKLETRDPRVITPKTVASAFELKDFWKAEAYVNTAQKKSEVTMTPAWSPGTIFLGVLKGGEFSNGGVGRTLVWTREIPQGGEGGSLHKIRTYRKEDTKTHWIEVNSYRDTHITNQFEGHLIETGATNADLMAA